jgi:Cellobiose phosphorylase
MNSVGHWSWDTDGLPIYHYTGGYPFSAKDKAGQDAKLPADPCFLLGNYRATIFAHASGMYEFITGERGWARLNYAGENKGWNQSIVHVSSGIDQPPAEYLLVGDHTNPSMQSHCRFGVGYANYDYRLDEQVTISKTISMQPSTTLHAGNPSMLIELSLRNESTAPVTVTYTEKLLVQYMFMNDQSVAAEERLVKYHNQLSVNDNQTIAKADISCEAVKLLVMPDNRRESFTHDIAPPSVFMHAAATASSIGKAGFEQTDIGDILWATAEVELRPGEQKSISLIIGLAFEHAGDEIERQVDQMLMQAKPNDESAGAYAHLWQLILPDLQKENDSTLRSEMLWNAYILEAMATYSQYFQETYIPQGSVYAYHRGENASNRDHLQHCLPLIYTNPALAKSCIRYAMKHTSRDGEIKRQNIGFGYSDPGVYMESDPQLYMFMAAAEYLNITGDYEFLNESVSYYPVEFGRQDTVLTFLVKHFVYLRDTVGRGKHGLIKMLNSDWSDSFFHPYSPNIYRLFAQSHLNTAMALAVIPRLLRELENSSSITKDKALLQSFISQFKQYHDELFTAFMADMKGRTFSARCYLCEDNEPELKFGMEHLCIEPQTYLLQIEGFPVERKKQLYAEIKSRVLDEEKHGARTREVPLWSNGDGEDGGIWFSHQGPLIVGLASFNKEEAVKLFKKLTFNQFAEHYPDYWVGHWTFADSLNSSLSQREGLYPYWVEDAFQPYCAHVHAWMLFCYYKLFNDHTTER